jgi:RimJ/RimL family protein N-acetyltransferase
MALLPDGLSSGDIDLERWRPDMADEMFAAVQLSFNELRLWMPWAQGTVSRQENLEALKNSQGLFDANLNWNYALRETSTGELVGAAGLHGVKDRDSPEIGYWVRSDRTSRGYATCAARALADAAFHYLPHAKEVKILMDKGNHASAAIPPKLGFRLLREEKREIIAGGHTGKGYVWVLERGTPLTRDVR